MTALIKSTFLLQNITELPKDLRYVLRFPSELRSLPQGFQEPLFFNWRTNLLFPLLSFGGPRGKDDDDGSLPWYNREGFLPIQNAIARAFVKVKKGEELPEIRMQRFPYPAYVHDILLQGLESLVSLMILSSFLYPCINTVRFIAIEKEKQLKESMKIMGLPNWLHWTGWFVRTMIYMVVSISLMVMLLKVKLEIFAA